MKVTIHDVGHGLCVSLLHDNGNTMLWDCGHAEWNRPSQFLASYGIGKIDRLFVTNYDEDHISDLPSIRSQFDIHLLSRNKSIDADQLRQLKLQSGPISSAMESMIDMMQHYTSPATNMPEFPSVRYATFSNTYKVDFNDTNNISLVTFLECANECFLIPGDLEVAGWNALLARDEFRRHLARVTVFIASHHGRENGYCSDVFAICSPKVVVFSDGPMQYTTQEMAATYAGHASGIRFNGNTRYVLSTRNDNSLTWTV